jgi:cytochrome c biogenesis protein CcmG/thiol:disulfide interchange protein DsbE
MKKRIFLLGSVFLMFGLSSGISQSFMETRLKNANGMQSSILKEAGSSELIVLDFWTTWCKPCIKAIPKIDELVNEFKNDNISFVGINADSPRNLAKVRPFINTHGIKYPVLLDTDQEIMNELLINAFPTLLIINREGKILFTHRGFANGDEKLIRDEISKLIKE